MENKIILIILGIFLIAVAGAVDYNISAGETIYIDLNQSYVNYTIDGANYSDFNISNNGTIVTIETSKYLQSLSFEITFFNEKGEAIQKYGSGGSSVKTYKKVEKEKLVNNVSIKEENIPEEDEVPEEDYFSNITGAIIGIMKNKSLIFILSFMILLVIIYIIVRKRISNDNDIKKKEIKRKST